MQLHNVIVLFVFSAEMVYRWNSGVLYRGPCPISNFCYSSTDNVCNLDCDSNNNCDGKVRGMILTIFYNRYVCSGFDYFKKFNDNVM